MRPMAIGSAGYGGATQRGKPALGRTSDALSQRDKPSVDGSLVYSGFVGAVRERWRRTRQRAIADQWIAWGAVPRSESKQLGPRSDELTSEKTRRALQGVCRRYVAEIHDPPCRAYAVNRIALANHVGALAELGTRLGDLSRPVSARSILLAREVVDGSGPLFNRQRSEELGPAIRRALRALDEDEALAVRED